jgi:hypothetical protein
MLWLLTQIWIWFIVALLLGGLAGWLFWARPLRRQADAYELSRSWSSRSSRSTAAL